MGVGVGGVEAVDIREQDEQVGLHTHGDAGGQGVVVADLNFFRGHGVVFVDDGQGVQLQQTDHGVVEVAEPVGLVHFLGSEQDLGHRVIVFPKGFVVGIHQLTLAHGGSGLLRWHILRALGQRELADAHADGPGRDQDDLVPGVFQVAEDLAQLLHPADVQQAGGVGQGRRAHFDHDAFVLHRKTPFETRTGGATRKHPPGFFDSFTLLF